MTSDAVGPPSESVLSDSDRPPRTNGPPIDCPATVADTQASAPATDTVPGRGGVGIEPPSNSRCEARTLVHDCQREGAHTVHDCSICGVFWTTRYDDEGNPFAVEVSL